jgi:hypothetical protein
MSSTPISFIASSVQLPCTSGASDLSSFRLIAAEFRYHPLSFS